MYVQMNDKLKEQILETCKKAEQKELETMSEPYKGDVEAVIPTIERVLEEELWGGYHHLKGQMPATWYHQMDRAMEIKILFPGGGFSVITIQKPVFDVPPHTYTYNLYNQPKEFPLAALPADRHERLIERHSTRMAVKAKHKTLREQIKLLLENVKSLNDAVTRFPNLRLFVPADYLGRLDKKQVRAKKGELPEGMKVTLDEELLASTGVMAKLNGL